MALCPTGWHVPLEEEWQQLEAFLGMQDYELDNLGYRGVFEEWATLKSSPEDEPSWNGTNLSGFSALPTGYRWDNGSFSYFQENSHFWSWDPDFDDPFFEFCWSSDDFFSRLLDSWQDGVGRSPETGRYGYSVRCLRSNVGCMDSEACNFEAGANEDDGTCVFAVEYYDCQGNCLSDADGDGICDEFEMLGCDDVSASNYNDTATDNDGSCTYVDGVCETCEDGVIVDNDADDDGVCNDDEIIGCQEVEAYNYAPAATSPAPCDD